MDYNKFIQSLADSNPGNSLNSGLKSLWFDKKGDWNKAHEIVQDEPDKISKMIHAYLHRKEGDIWNANYWYRAANTSMPNCSLEQEWENLVNQLI